MIRYDPMNPTYARDIRTLTELLNSSEWSRLGSGEFTATPEFRWRLFDAIAANGILARVLYEQEYLVKRIAVLEEIINRRKEKTG